MTHNNNGFSGLNIITEDDFFSDPNKYIDNAFDKSQKIDNYDIKKYVNEDHIATL